MARAPARVVRSPRFAERRRAVAAARAHGRRRIAGAIVGVAALAAGAAILVRSPFFELSEIEVVGARVLGASVIERASGLHRGQNLLAMNASAVERQIEALPGVSRARAERTGTSGVRLVVEEETAAFEVRTPSGTVLLDEEGRALPAGFRGTKRTVRIFAGGGATSQTGFGEAPFGQSVRHSIDVALEVWARLGRPFAEGISLIWVRAGGDLSFEWRGVRVRFGGPERITEKVDWLQRAIAAAERDGVRLRRVDVQAPDRPAAVLG